MATTKNRATKKAAKTPKETAAPDLIAEALRGFIDNVAEEDILRLITRGKRATKTAAQNALDAAKQQIAARSRIDLLAELGRARTQIEEIQQAALQGGDPKTALAARKELNKLLQLYDANNLNAMDAAAQTETERIVRAHLEGLKIVPEGLTLEELARQVSLWCLDQIIE